MASATIHVEASYRDESGRFASLLDAAAAGTIAEIVKNAEGVAKGQAPSRSGRLHNSIQGVVLSSHSGAVVAGTKYALYQEKGTFPHAMSGNVGFFWEREGRWWTPGPNTIIHPGNKGTHFMAYALKYMKARYAAIAEKHYPG